MRKCENQPMLNVYPDSLGGNLKTLAEFMNSPQIKGAFQSLYILPSVFHSDLDRGFSVIDYGINEAFGSLEDIECLKDVGIDLKLDFVLNHLSVRSPQFQDLLRYGEESDYSDFFINWNRFWEGFGEMTEDGYIRPEESLIKDMFFRKPGLPVLMVTFPNGERIPYWNTFYQKTWKEEEREFYLGQMDLNVKSPLIWNYYSDTLKTLASYGAKIVRLDAFAYASKEVGKTNFLNEPETWDLLQKIQEAADLYGLELLPEIHASYEERKYEILAEKGYMTYDFFLPGLILDALENHRGEKLTEWAGELITKKIRTVNMLGCHDGIPLLDLKGLLPRERIEGLIDIVVSRGGLVKNLHGQKKVYYQVNAAYYSALGEDDRKMLLARALQLFMPGKPQIWYLDLLTGTNDYEAVACAGEGGHKEINRTNFTAEQISRSLKKPVVRKQLRLLKFRSQFPAFAFDAECSAKSHGARIHIVWKRNGYEAYLEADLNTYDFKIMGIHSGTVKALFP